jgi:hypothetical protein
MVTLNFFSILILLFSASCSTTDPKLEPDLKLELKDVSCTEAWLQLTTNNIQLPITISLLKNNSVTQTFSLRTQDSLIYIDSLLPNQNYSFQVSSIQNPVSSNKVQVTTLDTTSHNFTWQTFEFGQHSSSTLYDVAIINENDIWAVGEIYMNDSLGNPDPRRYNAIKRNGSNWTVIRIPYNYQGADFYNPIQSVFAFSQNDIWFCGNGVIHWNGNNFVPIPIPTNVWGPFQMNKIWGSSGNDLYIVGNNGNIAHYNGSQWKKIESGTDLHIYDIWGNYDEELRDYEIYAVASKVAVNYDKRIIRINKSGDITSLSTNGIPSNLTGIWFKNKSFYVVGNGMFKKNDIESSSNWKDFHSELTSYHISDIRGNNYNDIIASGSFGELVHFNGIIWKSYINETYMNGAWGGTIKENIICCVGLKNNKAIVTIGKR